MKKEIKISLFILCLFILLSLFHLYPLSFHPFDGLHDPGDPLLNTWILYSVQKNLFTNPLNLFDGNIFHPLSNTLSLSEHLFPQALISLPFRLIWNNPIFTYNVIFFLSFVLNALAMFLLVKSLTQNSMAGFVCGIMYAFNTYTLNHIPHLQLISLWPLPLSMLFLHKFFERGKTKDSILFSFFFTIQALCCIYYGLFFISILLFILPLFLLIYHRKINFTFLFHLGIPLIFSGTILFLFSLPYLNFFQNMGLERKLRLGADLVHYLASSPRNRFLGDFLGKLGSAEHFLFPGIAVIILAGLSFYFNRNIFSTVPKILKYTLILCISGSLISIVIIILWGGMSLNMGFISFSMTSLIKSTLIFMTSAVLLLVLSLIFFLFKQNKDSTSENKNFFIYVFIFIWALLLSFGKNISFLGQSPKGIFFPFQWFHSWIPGFKGIRVPSRYAAIVIFALIVMAGYAFAFISRKIKKKPAQVYVAAGLALFLNLEHLTVPQRMMFFPPKKDIPPPYQWMKKQKENLVLLELPFFNIMARESIYMYFSCFHQKKLVNGYSGFFPPHIYYIRQLFKNFPSHSCIEVLKFLNVKYIILHNKMWNEHKMKKCEKRIQQKFSAELKKVKEFDYRFKKHNFLSDKWGKESVYAVSRAQQKPFPQYKIVQEEYKKIPPNEWEIHSNINSQLLIFLTDHKSNTRWTPRRKQDGDYLLVKFRKTSAPRKISLFMGKFPYDYALDMKVEISLNGKDWEIVPHGYSPVEFLDNLIHTPRDIKQNIYLEGKKIKYLKITQLGESQRKWWSVAEMKIYK